VASNRYPGESAIRRAAISCERNSPTGRGAEDGDCLPEQPTQLLDRHRVNVVLGEVRFHQFGESEGSRDSLLPPQPLQLPLQSLRRVPL
jgi:hypothetical protein